MTPERREQIEEICLGALDRDADARAEFLELACAGDEALRRDVESLLAFERPAEQFIETPALQAAAESMASVSLAAGEHVGAFEVLGLLGSGGMGDVYRARDPHLGRDVAIKILPPLFATDPERLARFEREARVLASVNHPNIAAIYGLERTSASRALILELVEGRTLAEMRREPGHRGGPGLALPAALGLARQIASALEAAHERGIVHRDLKPANITVTNDGTVKVLDFGLAKLAAPAEDDGIRSGGPAITITGAHDRVVLGTAAYMSPEQARGQPVDKRTDIWAFGCVLYEMVTGRPAFARATVTDTLAAVVNEEPDWARLPADTPAGIRRLLRRCLRKESQARLRDIGDAAIDIDEAQGSLQPNRRLPGVLRRRQRRRAWTAAGVLLGAALLVVLLVTRAPDAPPDTSGVTRLMINADPGAELTVNLGDRVLAISPDGTHIVYVGNPARWQLFVRPLNRLDATPLSDGRESVRGPFFSPDGRWVGYFSVQRLTKIPITGGSAVTLGTADGTPRGASWGEDGSIVFATNNTASGLWRIPDAGGEPSMLTRPDPARGERNHVWPELLPGGRAVLFMVVPAERPVSESSIEALDLQTGARKVVVERARNPRYVASGHLLYAVGGPEVATVHAVRFDLARLEIRGTAVPVLPQVVATTAPYFDVSTDGTLVYMPGPALPPRRTLVWVDRSGQEEPVNAPPRAYEHPRISPDGTRVAIASRDEDHDIWIWDFTREAPLRRFTFGPALELFPLWTPDGRQLLFASNRTGTMQIFRQAADGGGAAEPLTADPHIVRPDTMSPDGKLLVLAHNPATPDIVQLNVDAPERVQPLVATTAVEAHAALSPDGRWLAYNSWEGGTAQVYVQPFPDVSGGRWQVSTSGGDQPVWARNGEELFYVDPAGALMSARVDRGAAWSTDIPRRVLAPRPLMQIGQPLSYDVSPDGTRFLIITPANGPSQAPQSLVVVQNWFHELRRLTGGDTTAPRRGASRESPPSR